MSDTLVADFLRSLHVAKPEAALVGLFRFMAMSSIHPVEDRLPFFNQDVDTVVYEMALPHGRADIVIFHVDGSVTVIEAKDGLGGYTHVVQGIGQLALYAAQLNLKGKVRHVRSALLWSAIPDEAANAVVTLTCIRAGVIPLEHAPLAKSLAALLIRPLHETQEV